MFLIPVCNHYFFRTHNFDYAAYNFAFYDYAHFRVSPSPIYFVEGMSFLQDHLSFTFFFFIPFYWLFSWIFGTYTLLVLQSAFILYGGWAVYRLIDLETKSKLFATLALVLYFVSFGRYSSFLTDTNLMIFISSVVPVFLYHFYKGDYKLSIFWFAFLLLGRESIPLWTIFIALMLMIVFRKDKKRLKYSVWFGAVSLVYFVVAFKFLIPLVEDPNRPFGLFNYAALGEGPAEALKFMITHPIDSFLLLFENHTGEAITAGVKTEWYQVYMISGGTILLLRPYYILPLVPIVLGKMYNDSAIRWSIESYYSIEIVSLLPVLVFLTLNEMNWKKIATGLGVMACVGAVVMTLYKVENKNRVMIGWYDNVKYKFYDSRMYDSEYDHKQIYKYLDKIPSDAKVCASLHLTPHLSFRSVIHQFPRVDEAEYIALLKDDQTFPFEQDFYDSELAKYLESDEWKVEVEDEEFIMLIRK